MQNLVRFKINKLVRNNIPSIISANSAAAHTRIMQKDEYIKRLKDKLIEESI